ncbi:putative DNA-directed RNA polymerase I subunit RPA2 [Monocercomonoides exilis]|uniref:putative DNA-directed RNA polymerase I subunit RPA2 n=1 Tax=Monocercomonoides exilis TaxID=2049356 RepID=UPI00355A450C|nr:putative DNA-directed RNA polymerase I subunit RPA2 [Monocercomonoides exilis]|eukprot:MONOS_3925.1-p1 / transcript=MONOS_3925.1 / gene=MONOS_3925 / organism=Monocercomonoides_exilis_PA203 / gene_product=DNA-directed RNA polymerase I subunit RPA2, putative / transcript_product=DNA-directed RNA polymerase I subunit RPA2, putative / location=Mono_scaffold00097:118782-123146(-) / protein_length=1284 / sequence_SO=supercontig / SO=protein_coding / is_pseudo=false
MSKIEKNLQRLFSPHVDSYNFFVGTGIRKAVDLIEPNFITTQEGNRLRFWFENVQILQPYKSDPNCRDQRIFPRECREAKKTYSGSLQASLCLQYNDQDIIRIPRRLGSIPIMVKSARCHLYRMSAAELVAHGEEEHECGGFFIVHGLEKLIRMIVLTRQNYPMAVERNSYSRRGKLYSQFGVQMRCTRADQSSSTVVLHYLTDGTAEFRFQIRRQEFFLPVAFLMKALYDVTDKQIYEDVLMGDESNSFMMSSLEAILLHGHALNCFTRTEALAFIGKSYRTTVRWPTWWTDEECGADLLKQHVLVHLNSDADKYQILVVMLRKLLLLASGELNPENEDSAEMQEVLLPGQLMLLSLKEQLTNWLEGFRRAMERHMSMHPADVITDFSTISKVIDRNPVNITQRMEYLLATGTLVTQTGLDLKQTKGYVITAERLNYLRFISHFRSLHRGQFFTTMRTTEIRKLLPQSWGFICPVHTPDGGPCGLLNHLAALCQIVMTDSDTSAVGPFLVSCGMIPVEERPAMGREGAGSGMKLHKKKRGAEESDESDSESDGSDESDDDSSEEIELHHTQHLAPCVVDGRVVGFAKSSMLETMAQQLRDMKIKDPQKFSAALEVAVAPPTHLFSFPMLSVFSTPSRMMRPVVDRNSGKKIFIGSLEQTSISISCVGADERPDTFYKEQHPSSMLSVVASLTPFSDYNQSPRNLYQCQMGKQTMGTPYHAMRYRNDSKSNRITHVQKPVVRNTNQDVYDIDSYPQGVNACVAVISYTGFDMEDAMIINKSSFERGFGHGGVFITKEFELEDERGMRSGKKSAGQQAYAAIEKKRKEEREMAAASGNANAQSASSSSSSYSSSLVAPVPENMFVRSYFTNINPKTNELIDPKLDIDGFPFIGDVIRKGDPLCAYVTESGEAKINRYKLSESGIVEAVTLASKGGVGGSGAYSSFSAGGGGQGGAGNAAGTGMATGGSLPHLVRIKLRLNRNPVIGDKFSSRHGQKGVLSVLWPDVDMPFTETGITPDCIINPHAFPSRMTIGMMIEAMAGKAGGAHGVYEDGTPFQFTQNRGLESGKDDESVVDYIGKQLVKAGYNYYGSEPLYSGVSGELLKAEIFFGVVYYQRLRHMVSDKFQVRSTGPVNALTHQPVKGRKMGGGIRLGEMERDSLIAHGVSFIMQDRLLHCSDEHETHICTKCGSLVSVVLRDRQPSSSQSGGMDKAQTTGMGQHQEGASTGNSGLQERVCLLCGSGEYVGKVRIPYVLLYLANEIAGMNLKLQFQTRKFTDALENDDEE